jgi:hypothetical protein
MFLEWNGSADASRMIVALCVILRSNPDIFHNHQLFRTHEHGFLASAWALL